MLVNGKWKCAICNMSDGNLTALNISTGPLALRTFQTAGPVRASTLYLSLALQDHRVKCRASRLKITCAVCSFDITKCFDTINHSILLKKMEYYGMQSENIKWFKSYLNEREQMVSCHNTLSGKSTISIGVPQGSVLGPLLFLIYVNDINRHVHLGACNLYADDTLVYCSGSTMSELKHNIQQCVSDIHEWYDQNKLVINKPKYSVMLATTIQRILHIDYNNLDVHIGDYKLVQSDCIYYLGVKIDETISWNKQTDNIILCVK